MLFMFFVVFFGFVFVCLVIGDRVLVVFEFVVIKDDYF